MNFVFRPVYSWLLVPLTFILYICIPILRPYLIPLMASIAVVGMIAIILYERRRRIVAKNIRIYISCNIINRTFTDRYFKFT